MLTSGPVRALEVVSVKLKMAVVDTPVSAAAVQVKSVVDGADCVLHEKAVVYVLIARLRFPVGTPKPDHAVEPAPQAAPVLVILPLASICTQKCPLDAAIPGKVMLEDVNDAYVTGEEPLPL